MNQPQHLRITRKDFNITYFKSSGSGGQKKNKTSNCVRLLHRDSGAMVEAVDSRQQSVNRKIALERLVKHPKFVSWLHLKMAAPSDFLVEERITSPDGKTFWVPAHPNLAIDWDDLTDFIN